ncbi:MAG: hypothetical protein JNJ83_14465 [Verrucomicrobiaceae bacterium]|nr:hypothetical protein [Verrucomicrobiaceae bacterium]
MKLINLALGVIAVSTASAQMPDELASAERAKLLSGVTSIPKIGSPGPVAIWGEFAFPILSAPDKDGVEIPLAAAAGHGQGRIILFGQNGYLKGSTNKDTERLLENCMLWASGGKSNPRVGLFDVSLETIPKARVRVEKLPEINLRSLNGFDVVVINMQGTLEPDMGAALLDFAKKGGGIIGGMTGWAFESTSGGKNLVVSHGVNQALLTAGIAFTDLSAFDSVSSFQARTEIPSLVNAAVAINAIRANSQGTRQLKPEETKQAMNAIQLALAVQPPGRTGLQAAVYAALGNSGLDTTVPSPSSPLTTATHQSQRLRLGMETRSARLMSVDQIKAHPAHEAFPGKIAADAQRTSVEIEINPSVQGWHSTGMYAAAGDIISVTVPESAVNAGYAVRIGCHTDSLYHLDSWKRAPEITRKDSIVAVKTRTASAFGGLIYFDVPSRTKDATSFNIKVENAVPAPLFVLGRDDDTTWKQIRERPAPWAELACDKIVISCPSEAARTINNPTQLMHFWKSVVEAQDEISNQALERRRPERMVADVQISAGYMHSGYPIMVPTSAAMEMVTFTRLKFPGWGFYHEIGHNHQRPWFTFEGTGEVTNNVLALYCYDAVLKKAKEIGHDGVTKEHQKTHIQKIKEATNKWDLWKSDPFLALTIYIQLIDEFGWEPWRKYLHSFDDKAFGPKPANSDAARDQFLVRYSQIVGKDLSQLFDFWGIPVSSSARSQVTKLEPWIPDSM